MVEAAAGGGVGWGQEEEEERGFSSTGAMTTSQHPPHERAESRTRRRVCDTRTSHVRRWLGAASVACERAHDSVR